MYLDGENMQVQTKFLWLRKPAALGDLIGGWRVCWLGGWDRCRVFFVAMVARESAVPVADLHREGGLATSLNDDLASGKCRDQGLFLMPDIIKNCAGPPIFSHLLHPLR